MKEKGFLSGKHQLLLIATLISLSGCISQTTHTENYSLHFKADTNVNEGNPLKVNFFFLKSNTSFMFADFYSLQSNYQTLLGLDLLYSEEFFLHSGKLTYKSNGQIPIGARYIGIIAEYKLLDVRQWRLLQPIPDLISPYYLTLWPVPNAPVQADFFLGVNGIVSVGG